MTKDDGSIAPDGIYDDDAKEALKLARGIFDDGITFEIHSYVNSAATAEQIWGLLK